MKQIGYARVSTDAQTVLQQTLALKSAGCRHIFTDEGVSATAPERPGLREARALLCPGDVFVVTAIDRAFRSTRDAINFLDDLTKAGIGFRSLTQQLDTTTPEGKMWFTLVASWAEYERDLISRRTREKMALARKHGQHLGRPRKLSEAQVRNAHHRITSGGVRISHEATRLGVSYDTLARAMIRYQFAA